MTVRFFTFCYLQLYVLSSPVALSGVLREAPNLCVKTEGGMVADESVMQGEGLHVSKHTHTCI